MQCADITFSANALSIASDVCFNSTGVGSAPFTYNGDTKATCDSASNATGTGGKTTSNSAANNLKISIASVGAVGLAVAVMMM